MSAASTQIDSPTAQIINGKAIADSIRKEIADEVKALQEKYGKVPGLAVVLVGTKGDSATYVRMKRKACADLGIQSFSTDLPGDVSEEDLLKVVADYNANEEVHGILVQLPLPKHIDEQRILDAISLEKDVDGFHPANIGALAMRGRTPLFTSCTPKGCLELLKRSGVAISGKRAVVLGRSNIVGMPVAHLLQACALPFIIISDATVTVVHSRTPDARAICAEADILVAAIGQAEMVRGDWIKPGAAVIDVGTNPIPDASKKSGYRLVGDVAFSEAKERAGFITPVPGGVGPMTITMLLSNTVDGARRTFEKAAAGQ
ncbi:hypothetical protein COCSUDRAFT_26703 [Coccomyxa subellipsoidea C-169]|uniref:Uncharacterized protein n=1 Tax=Coccomyxa subellipsoidea (strain C-169) TaxID=574566 RepID=I0Z9S6_COCSC|nr:hypothetical protein COCSUDRAFT_26703 [Coccomyxa subellipsoidea C-169]EIE27395.1 hypothetical protein COCSUDRAFT_26703 [Coccomyxa subellipsoidea C-169]|eukprot:XP_005651939.1 hypothetical protein COCSUDRAFT_26703 [Coccomyxa subellipsoidea C-169]